MNVTRANWTQIDSFGVADKEARGKLLVDSSELVASLDFEPINFDDIESKEGTRGGGFTDSPIVDFDDVVDFLRRSGLKLDPSILDGQRDVVEKALSTGNNDAPIPVAKGQKPMPGRDGYFEWSNDIESTSPSSSALYGEQHSPHRKAIQEGGVIGRLWPPKSGTPGVDVFGEDIPVKEGVSRNLEGGPNVEYDPDERIFRATESGWIALRANRLSVYPVYQVSGPLDYSIGKIDFPGSVEIERDVLDGFDIRSGKDVYVGGTVGAIELEADGRVKVQGGIAGKKRGAVQTGDRLAARFLSGCEVESNGRIDVEHGIMHSDVGTLDRLDTPKGKILGGRIISHAGVEAGILGSSMGIKTIVIVGVPYPIVKQVERLQLRLGELNREIADVQQELKNLCGNFDSFEKLPKPRREAIRRELELRRQFRRKRDEIRTEIPRLREKLTYNKDASITIRKAIHPGVEIQLGPYRTSLEESWEGPLRVEVNKSSGQIQFRRLRHAEG